MSGPSKGRRAFDPARHAGTASNTARPAAGPELPNPNSIAGAYVTIAQVGDGFIAQLERDFEVLGAPLIGETGTPEAVESAVPWAETEHTGTEAYRYSAERWSQMNSGVIRQR